MLRGFYDERFFELELRKADERLKFFRQLRIIYRMSQVFVTGRLCKIKPDAYVQYNRLFVFPLVGEGPDDTVEPKVPEADLAGFNYHTKRTIAAVKLAPATPNQMLRAVAWESRVFLLVSIRLSRVLRE